MYKTITKLNNNNLRRIYISIKYYLCKNKLIDNSKRINSILKVLLCCLNSFNSLFKTFNLHLISLLYLNNIFYLLLIRLKLSHSKINIHLYHFSLKLFKTNYINKPNLTQLFKIDKLYLLKNVKRLYKHCNKV